MKPTHKYLCFLSAVFLLFFAASESLAYNNDSTEILAMLSAKHEKIRSGKIHYKSTTKSFFRTTPSISDCELRYTIANNHPIAYLRRKITPYPFTDEILFYSDSCYEAYNDRKIITFSSESSDTFIDFFDDTFWMYSFGLYPQIPSGIFSDPGTYTFSNKIIDGDTCYQIFCKNLNGGYGIDSSIRTWVISKKDCSHSSYQKTSWGHDGNTSEFSQTCTKGEYSEQYDSLLLRDIKRRLFQYTVDSAYSLITDVNAYWSDLEAHRKKLSVGDSLPTTLFRTMENKDVDISTIRSNYFFLDFGFMASGPWRRSLPIISRLYAKYKDSSIAFFGIDPFDKTEKDFFTNLTKKYHLDYPVLFSDKKTVYEDLGITDFPAYLILDKNMKIRYISRGYLAEWVESEIESNISKLLRE